MAHPETRQRPTATNGEAPNVSVADLDTPKIPQHHLVTRVSGSVLIDLSDVESDRIRRSVAACSYAPDGCRVVLVVGAMVCDPEAVRILRDQVHRLEYEVLGEPRAVAAWVTALRHGLGDRW